jgi:hypothetical protein
MLLRSCRPSFASLLLFASSGANAADLYALDFVAPAARGNLLNDAGDVAGTAYIDEGCGPWCLPDQETVVWVDGERLSLPTLPGFAGIYVTGMNSDGWVSGLAGSPGTTTRAVVWKPVAGDYEIVDVGMLPDTSSSYTSGIDDAGRVVGWSSEGGAIPTVAGPFVWTEDGGMTDLTDGGFPAELPLAVSPNGMVATPDSWYSLDDAATVTPLADPPRGFLVGTYASVINDSGEQARFLVSTSTENLVYLFRYHADGTWQQISSTGTGHLTTYGLGSITSGGDVTATVLGTAVIAYGPDGVVEPLEASLSSAYPDSTIEAGGPINDEGTILAQVMIGRSDRLVKLVPVEPCKSDCIEVAKVTVRSRFVQDPTDPGHCYEDGVMYNSTNVQLTVTNESGAPLRGVNVSGRFLDDYWTNEPVTGATNAKGIVRFHDDGLCGVGAVAFLVDDATRGTRVLDRTTGTLAGYAIPR